MKKNLDWQSPKLVKHYDDAPLWSAPFGQLLLENIPLKKGMTVLDIGFGTGFPLLELSQRLGESATIYGVDIWKAALQKTRDKIELFQLANVTILEESANNISLQNDSIDLICSNLGINNFANAKQVYSECYRLLKQGANLALTSNPIGTFKELEIVFSTVLTNMNCSHAALSDYFNARGTKESICKQIEEAGFVLQTHKSKETHWRFTDAKALFNHSMIRIAFRSSWENFVPQERREDFLSKSIQLIEQEIQEVGVFKLSIPILYLQFQK